MIGEFRSVVLDAPDITRLASFYGELAGLSRQHADDDWITMKTPEGWRIAFQLAPDHIPPRWPDSDHPQQFHLDFRFPERAEGVERALALGATRLPELGEGWTVLADPAGHPFCVCQGDPAEPVKLAGITIDCPDAAALGRFYAELLGYAVTYEGPEGVAISADGQPMIFFQQIEVYNSPQWPDPSHPQQFHLDVTVTDVEQAQAQALAIGATWLPGGGSDFRVYADPAGHPFCLCW